MREGTGDAFQVIENRLENRLPLADQALERVARPSIAEDEVRAEFAAIGHSHTRRLSTLNEDFLDLGADDDLSATTFDHGFDGFGDTGRPPAG